MPAQVQQALFQPMTPFLTLDGVVEENDNFQYVDRVDFATIEAQGADALNKLVTLHVVMAGKPLVIENCHKKLPRHLFDHAWLDENLGNKRK
jgi:DNA-binding transcriptional regulator YbjK